jgi:hypothetical protein
VSRGGLSVLNHAVPGACSLEFSVFPPKVVFKHGDQNEVTLFCLWTLVDSCSHLVTLMQILEPLEELVIDCAGDIAPTVINKLMMRCCFIFPGLRCFVLRCLNAPFWLQERRAEGYDS